MSSDKACIVFTTGLEQKAQAVALQLNEQGFEVCMSEADQSEVEAAQAEQPVSDEIQSCIDNAIISIFLIPEEHFECLEAAAEHAATCGTRIVAITENVELLPTVFDEHAYAVLTIGSTRLDQVISGEPVWECADGSLREQRDIVRVKCQ
ncbi:hypothetical protein LG197_22360 [Pseudomonas asiatica]|uniref:Uncharacterized protein n=1 Tax=Pseudomonas monteilii TaxID=76759 RepID=A0A2N1IN35_9PSED|nr:MULTISPECIES: hypothetical protein [Pseudomonas]PKI19653.1 hypothetical protein CXB65_21605 [Pseudomonas monteilii]RPD93833.1 hypothetical protein EGN69_13240 [Pseudomonas monteilii]WDM87339.1 hypothetical protein LG197_22360 [Pseudomonas asiatica]